MLLSFVAGVVVGVLAPVTLVILIIMYVESKAKYPGEDDKRV